MKQTIDLDCEKLKQLKKGIAYQPFGSGFNSVIFLRLVSM